MPDFLVDAVATANVNLNSPPATMDTFPLVAGASKIALVGQTDATQNGVYDYTAAPALVRNTTDGAASSMVYPRTFGVRRGSPDNKHSEWQFDNDAAPALGADAVAIARARWPRALDASAGLKRNGPDLSIATTGILAGTYSRATFNDRGQATGGQSAEAATTFFEGLRVVWLSANSVRVEEGACYVPAAGRVIDAPLDIDLSGLVLAAATWYYVYYYESGGAGAVEISAQRPASPYRGAARVKGGGTGGVLDNTNPDTQPDDTRRYVPNSAFKTHPTLANTILRFEKYPNGYTRHLAAWNTLAANGGLKLLDVARVASGGTLDTDLSPLMPPTGKRANLQGFVQFVTALANLWGRGPDGVTRTTFLGEVAGSAVRSPFTTDHVPEPDRTFFLESLVAATDVTLACIGYWEDA